MSLHSAGKRSLRIKREENILSHLVSSNVELLRSREQVLPRVTVAVSFGGPFWKSAHVAYGEKCQPLQHVWEGRPRKPGLLHRTDGPRADSRLSPRRLSARPVPCFLPRPQHKGMVTAISLGWGTLYPAKPFLNESFLL